MLARSLDGVAVLVSPDRYLAGRLAEHHFGCTVHVLDDGFQHFPLRRNADILVVAGEDLARPETLPSGRLREPLDAVRAADALIALDDMNRAGLAVMAPGRPIWQARRRQGPARPAHPGMPAPRPSDGPVVAVAGIANPSGFFADLRAAGWTVARELPYRDHHPYSRANVRWIADAVNETGAAAVLTTEKDLVRLLPFRPFPVRVAFVPLVLELDDAASFDSWLASVLKDARA